MSSSRTRPVSLLSLLLALGLWFSATPAAAQTVVPTVPAAPAPAPAAEKPQEEKPKGPAPIPATSVVARAEQDENAVTTIRSRLQISGQAALIRRTLSNLSTESADVRRRSRAAMQSFSQRRMRDLEPAWRALQAQVEAQNRTLTQMAESLQADIDKLGGMQKTWEATRDSEEIGQTPQTIRTRITKLLQQIETTRQSANQARSTLFELQTQSTNLLGSVNSDLNLLRNRLTASIDALLSQDAPMLYGAPTSSDVGDEEQPVGLARLQDDAESIKQYLYGRPLTLLGLFMFMLVLFGFLQRFASHFDNKIAQSPRLASVRWLLAVPFWVALICTVGVAWTVLPFPPASMQLAMTIAALVSAVMLLRQVVDHHVAPFLYWLLVMYAFNQVPEVFRPDPLLERIFFQVQMGSTIALLLLLQWRRKQVTVKAVAEAAAEDEPISSDGLPPVEALEQKPAEPGRKLQITGRIITAMLIGCSAALLCDLAGFTRLGRFVSQSTLTALFSGLILFTGAMVCISLLRLALHVRPLNQLQMVRADGLLIETRTRKLINFIFVLLWIAYTLNQTMLLPLVTGAIGTVFSAPLHIGQLSISLGDVLRFLFILFAATQVSKLVRYVLDQEVFTRISLPRGIPYAFTTVLNYVVLIGGLLLAIAATGISLDRFTIFASAIGVGVGFGLQTIVNNFVSGLIVLFSRPIKVGDSVDLSGQSGRVQRIGIRASTLRTSAGADVIVPNSLLISNQVVNWTLMVPQRRIEIVLGVGYDSDPEQVMKLLTDIAGEHKEVLTTPRPTAQFSNFGASAMEFKLYAYTAFTDRVGSIRSDLCVKIHKTFKQENIALTGTG
ncbi:MAG: mechanosensitive ion channel [Lautropia sp.]|nr:mechanosensitive ion channel [Lautropia sp.]